MPMWEYRIEESKTGKYKGEDCTGPFIKRLNELGKEGWEAVNFEVDPYTKREVVLLKRPVVNK